MTEATTELTLSRLRALRSDLCPEMTGHDADAVAADAGRPGTGTQAHLIYIGSEEPTARLATAGSVARLGLVSVRHVSARRPGSAIDLAEMLGGFAAVDHLMIHGGDPARPLGPFREAFEVSVSSVLSRRGVLSVGVAGYPQGYTDIADELLWEALTAKISALDEEGIDAPIVTPFNFAADRECDWIGELWNRDLGNPVAAFPGPSASDASYPISACSGSARRPPSLARCRFLNRLLRTAGGGIRRLVGWPARRGSGRPACISTRSADSLRARPGLLPPYATPDVVPRVATYVHTMKNWSLNA
ncbi:hypothetical protein [Nocardioides sp. KR10-350]|uniref:hypothetical protein n=1 Tax=Nocardioides cheoyonin TaxID=3156615 RepID=UPI0032B5D321